MPGAVGMALVTQQLQDQHEGDEIVALLGLQVGWGGGPVCWGGDGQYAGGGMASMLRGGGPVC